MIGKRQGTGTATSTAGAVWGRASATGTVGLDADAERVLKALHVDLSFDRRASRRTLGVDPYDKVTSGTGSSSPEAKRRSLDDMRRLSEEIKARQRAR